MISLNKYLLNITSECSKFNKNIDLCYKKIKLIQKNKKRIFFIGNGASNTIGSHFALDFSKNLNIQSYALDSASLLTACTNDYGYENMFSKYLSTFKIKNDLLIAISSSGNSSNIINAVKFFRNKGAVITLSGINKDNNLMKQNTKGINFFINLEGYNQVEAAHNLILAYICDLVKGKLIYKVN